MASLIYVLEYITINNPKNKMYAIQDLIRIAYLCDWKSSIEYGRQITSVEWKFKNFEPILDNKSVQELTKYIKRRGFFVNRQGKLRRHYSQKFRRYYNPIRLPFYKERKNILDKTEKSIIDWVLNSVSLKSRVQLAKLVYSTYPAFLIDDEVKANLPELATLYKKAFPSSDLDRKYTRLPS